MKWSTSLQGNNPLKVGVTGGIGSGKSVVCRIFAQLGIPVFWADQEAKREMDQNSFIQDKLKEWFGNDIYLSEIELNRKKLAEIIFNDKIALEKVNELIHPVVREEFKLWTQKQVAPYVVQEAAILFETGQEGNFDHIIVATADLELRIQRVMNRDGISRARVLERMNNQIPNEVKVQKADDVIICDDDHLIIPQVIGIHHKLLLKWQNLENG
jgi:dephospho-CoA kinase